MVAKEAMVAAAAKALDGAPDLVVGVGVAAVNETAVVDQRSTGLAKE